MHRKQRHKMKTINSNLTLRHSLNDIECKGNLTNPKMAEEFSLLNCYKFSGTYLDIYCTLMYIAYINHIKSWVFPGFVAIEFPEESKVMLFGVFHWIFTRFL